TGLSLGTDAVAGDFTAGGVWALAGSLDRLLVTGKLTVSDRIFARTGLGQIATGGNATVGTIVTLFGDRGPITVGSGAQPANLRALIQSGANVGPIRVFGDFTPSVGGAIVPFIIAAGKVGDVNADGTIGKAGNVFVEAAGVGVMRAGKDIILDHVKASN